MTTSASGPFLAAALLCENILEEKDGVLSAIRIVDRIIHGARGPNPPEDMPPVPVNLRALISLKSGAARGRFAVGIVLEKPSGQREPAVEIPVLLEGEDRGANLNIALAFQAELEGLYWFEVQLDGQPITRMPLRLIYQRLSLGGGSPAPS